MKYDVNAGALPFCESKIRCNSLPPMEVVVKTFVLILLQLQAVWNPIHPITFTVLHRACRVYRFPTYVRKFKGPSYDLLQNHRERD